MTDMRLPRLLGVATAGYGIAVAKSPAVLLDPCGWADTPALRTTARMVALRDVTSGLAMALAPDRATMRLAIAVRVGSDLADTAALATALRGGRRAKAPAVTTGWALLCLASARSTRVATPAARASARREAQ